jgi:hypothetical protein
MHEPPTTSSTMSDTILRIMSMNPCWCSGLSYRAEPNRAFRTFEVMKIRGFFVTGQCPELACTLVVECSRHQARRLRWSCKSSS